MSPSPSEAIRILIVDDEEQACDNLHSILSEHITCNIAIVGTARDTQSAWELIKIKAPDLVFLDIHMPGENAFEFLQRIGDFSFEIIFVTAFDDYALKAFKLNAIDYILKPINIAEVVQAVDRTRERLLQKKILQKDHVFYSKLLKQVYSKTALDQFTFKRNNTVQVIPFKDIVCIEAVGGYSKVFYLSAKVEKTVVLSHSLSEYEELLPAELFYRVHKSYLVNRMHVVNVVKDSSPAIQLSSERTLPVGRRRLPDFLSFLKNAI